METPNNDESLSLFRTMLFGDDRFEGRIPQSKAPGDTAKVLIRSNPFGEHLRSLDPTEKFFHVEFFKSIESPFYWSEIWLSFEWKESNARHTAIKNRSDSDREFRHKNNARLKAVEDKLKDFGFNQPGFAAHLGKEILQNWKDGNYSEMLKTLDLASTLASFDEEDKEPKQ